MGSCKIIKCGIVDDRAAILPNNRTKPNVTKLNLT